MVKNTANDDSLTLQLNKISGLCGLDITQQDDPAKRKEAIVRYLIDVSRYCIEKINNREYEALDRFFIPAQKICRKVRNSPFDRKMPTNRPNYYYPIVRDLLPRFIYGIDTFTEEEKELCMDPKTNTFKAELVDLYNGLDETTNQPIYARFKDRLQILLNGVTRKNLMYEVFGKYVQCTFGTINNKIVYTDASKLITSVLSNSVAILHTHSDTLLSRYNKTEDDCDIDTKSVINEILRISKIAMYEYREDIATFPAREVSTAEFISDNAKMTHQSRGDFSYIEICSLPKSINEDIFYECVRNVIPRLKFGICSSKCPDENCKNRSCHYFHPHDVMVNVSAAWSFFYSLCTTTYTQIIGNKKSRDSSVNFRMAIYEAMVSVVTLYYNILRRTTRGMKNTTKERTVASVNDPVTSTFSEHMWEYDPGEEKHNEVREIEYVVDQIINKSRA